jgi:hypothetical protein
VSRCLRVAFVALFIALGTNVAAPAWACGCGAYIPDNAHAAVTDERALITWDGSTQSILMSFTVRGGSDRAAWVMPLPAAAQVTLGDAAVFDELARISAARIEYRDSWWPTFDWLRGSSDRVADARAGAADGAVTVLGSQQIGPFTVTRLAAGDPVALAAWLTDRGFPYPPGLERNIAPYLAEGWETVALQLTPAAPGEQLAGDLQPLRLSFTSDTVVYPMRLSRAAVGTQSVDLYVLGEHRMDPSATPVPGRLPTLEFSGPVDASAVAPALRPYLESGSYLTRWSDRIPQPDLIDGDYVFTRADTDTVYQKVVVLTRDHGAVSGFVLLAGAGAAAVLTIVGAVVLRRRRIGQTALPAQAQAQAQTQAR